MNIQRYRLKLGDKETQRVRQTLGISFCAASSGLELSLTLSIFPPPQIYLTVSQLYIWIQNFITVAHHHLSPPLASPWPAPPLYVWPTAAFPTPACYHMDRTPLVRLDRVHRRCPPHLRGCSSRSHPTCYASPCRLGTEDDHIWLRLRF